MHPKFLSLVFFCLLATCVTLAQSASPSWSPAEIRQADLARGVAAWSTEEADVLLHVNLARLFPKKYWELEISSWEMPSGWSREEDRTEMASLRATLMSMTPAPALRPSSRLRNEALCLAEQQSRSGQIGHERGASCRRSSNSYWAENCSYGMRQGADVIAQLLIDSGVPSLGHRKNCLNPELSYLGVNQQSHPRYRHVTVMDFSSKP